MLNKHRQEAQSAYAELLSFHGESLGSNGTHSDEVRTRRDGISLLIMQFLCQCVPQERFQFTEFPSLIYKTAAADIFRPEKVLTAFLNIERYLLLLCLMPWKQEYHRIKKYGGFYQSKIESHLHNVDSIFELVGFKEHTSGSLALSDLPDVTRLQDVAFECFVASVECKIIGTVYVQGVKKGITPFMVVEIRSQHSGTAEHILSLVEQKNDKIVNDNEPDGSLIVKPVDKNKNRVDPSYTAPFHNKLEVYMRTAKQMNDADLKSEKNSHGDAIDIPYIDEDVNKEVEFTKGTLDDHLMASLQIVGDKEVKPATAVDPSQHSVGGSQEWSFVREGLERKHGKKYFDGLRKDILVDTEDKSDQTLYPVYDGSQPVPMRHSPLQLAPPKPCGPNPTADSGYMSQSTKYPSTIPARQTVPMRKVPPMRHTDVVIRKSPEMYPDAKPLYSKTVPLVRRLSGNVSEQASKSYHGMPSQPSAVYIPTTVPQDVNKIKIAQKRSSVPVIGVESSVPINNVQQKLLSSSVSSRRMGSSGYGTNLSSPAIDSGIGSSSGSKSRSISMPVSNVTISSAAVKAKWSCRHCTFINSMDSIVCDMCSKTRDGQVEMDSPSAGDISKACSKCTLENQSGSVLCHACGSELSGVQTVV